MHCQCALQSHTVISRPRDKPLTVLNQRRWLVKATALLKRLPCWLAEARWESPNSKIGFPHCCSVTRVVKNETEDLSSLIDCTDQYLAFYWLLTAVIALSRLKRVRYSISAVQRCAGALSATVSRPKHTLHGDTVCEVAHDKFTMRWFPSHLGCEKFYNIRNKNVSFANK